eukprot:TRINITY_DN4730_c0_g1_i5.p2 TRINITY_DN4730_c0_g1~~TRINITY_DN4730_c0_g1_i5.p2  ORF type:complete len:318 (+),score=-30.32 TRINITY_DN4730_c0_g1_i5:785-1738(+)
MHNIAIKKFVKYQQLQINRYTIKFFLYITKINLQSIFFYKYLKKFQQALKARYITLQQINSSYYKILYIQQELTYIVLQIFEEIFVGLSNFIINQFIVKQNSRKTKKRVIYFYIFTSTVQIPFLIKQNLFFLIQTNINYVFQPQKAKTINSTCKRLYLSQSKKSLISRKHKYITKLNLNNPPLNYQIQYNYITLTIIQSNQIDILIFNPEKKTLQPLTIYNRTKRQFIEVILKNYNRYRKLITSKIKHLYLSFQLYYKRQKLNRSHQIIQGMIIIMLTTYDHSIIFDHIRSYSLKLRINSNCLVQLQYKKSTIQIII